MAMTAAQRETLQDVTQFDDVFPYLKSPIPGAPNVE